MEGRDQPYKRQAVAVPPLPQRVREVMALLRPQSSVCSDLAQPHSGYLKPRETYFGDWSGFKQDSGTRLALKRLRSDQFPEV
jgi:hypothetical protein